jgi:hypothetical protein
MMGMNKTSLSTKKEGATTPVLLIRTVVSTVLPTPYSSRKYSVLTSSKYSEYYLLLLLARGGREQR